MTRKLEPWMLFYFNPQRQHVQNNSAKPNGWYVLGKKYAGMVRNVMCVDVYACY